MNNAMQNKKLIGVFFWVILLTRSILTEHLLT